MRWIYHFYCPLYLTDIDECSTTNPCGQNCKNTPGSFQCSCKAGYKVDPRDWKKCLGKKQENIQSSESKTSFTTYVYKLKSSLLLFPLLINRHRRMQNKTMRTKLQKYSRKFPMFVQSRIQSWSQRFDEVFG